jgi:hypothetical protein
MNIKIQTGLYGSEFFVDLVGNRNTLNSSNRDLVALVEEFLDTEPNSEWGYDLQGALKEALLLVDEYLEDKESVEEPVEEEEEAVAAD